jgi:isopenicillin N synthase-like dioxygenase
MSVAIESKPALASISLTQAQADPEGFSQALGASFARYGFAVVSDHGIPPHLTASAEASARSLFDLPETVKRAYHVSGAAGQRGYTPFGVETAKGATAHDLKEFWHVGRSLPPGHPYADAMPSNLWPRELPDFRDTLEALYSAFDTAGLRILEAIARYLGLAADHFQDAVCDGNSVLRLLHYPPVDPAASGVRAGAHEDINVITLLLGAEEAGLELLDRDGSWLAIAPAPGHLVINVGDMLERLTNRVLRSTTHRVVKPPPERRGRSRYSMPFFLHFRPDFLIETLPTCISTSRPNAYPEAITADEFLMQRLREIKLA